MTARPTSAMSANIPFPVPRPSRCSQWTRRESSPTPSLCGPGEITWPEYWPVIGQYWSRNLKSDSVYSIRIPNIDSILKSTKSNPWTQILANQSCWFCQAQTQNPGQTLRKQLFAAWDLLEIKLMILVFYSILIIVFWQGVQVPCSLSGGHWLRGEGVQPSAGHHHRHPPVLHSLVRWAMIDMRKDCPEA